MLKIFIYKPKLLNKRPSKYQKFTLTKKSSINGGESTNFRRCKICHKLAYWYDIRNTGSYYLKNDLEVYCEEHKEKSKVNEKKENYE